MDFPLRGRRLKQGMLWVGILAFSGIPTSFADFDTSFQYFDQNFQVDTQANTHEQQLVHVTTDVAQGSSDFKVLLNDDSQLVAMRYYVNGANPVDYSAEQLSQGVVLIRSNGYDVLKLKGSNLDSSHGGILQITYLSNGITNEYGKFDMELSRTGGQWQLLTNSSEGRRPFTSMFMEGRQVIGQWVGIKRIVVK